MVGWHHQLNGCESEQPTGDGERQGNLVCCSPWGQKKSDTTELNWTEPVFLPGKSHGQRSLAVYCPWQDTVHGVTKSHDLATEQQSYHQCLTQKWDKEVIEEKASADPNPNCPCLDGLTFLPKHSTIFLSGFSPHPLGERGKKEKRVEIKGTEIVQNRLQSHILLGLTSIFLSYYYILKMKKIKRFII